MSICEQNSTLSTFTKWQVHDTSRDEETLRESMRYRRERVLTSDMQGQYSVISFFLFLWQDQIKCVCVWVRVRVCVCVCVCVGELFTGPTVQPSDDRPVILNHYENCQEQTEALGEETNPVSLCPSQVPHNLQMCTARTGEEQTEIRYKQFRKVASEQKYTSNKIL